MDDNTNGENNSVESDKPVLPLQNMDEEIIFPPFPDPKNEDFEDDISMEERNHYRVKFKDLSTIVNARLHCTACDRHLGCSVRTENRMRAHPMLRTLMCHACHAFYNSGEFEKGDDGSELYCRWCGQGGQVYCCSNCPHVFCAKCIKRNLGMPMIKEIEETDDWKCFRCNSKYLWDLRAICWALFRYCDLKSKITYETQDIKLKEAYQKQCEIDYSECCKNRSRRKEKNDDKKTKLKEDSKKTPNTSVKTPSTIQVKKFASINAEDHTIKNDKKAQKRAASPKHKPIFIKDPVTMTPKMLTPVMMPPIYKKMRMPAPSTVTPMRYNDRKQNNSQVMKILQKPAKTINMPILYNGYNNSTPLNNVVISDNINLSLESLTQGLDMATVAEISNNSQDDVVCTPDFPLEPLCEVLEDNADDDVQCIGPVVTPKVPPPLVARNAKPIPELAKDNIIQMTENDVTVNTETGGLKFRVDPQTLSSNKMYRLPDGRVFAINANPSMPGGYSATIVAVVEDACLKLPPKGSATYAAKLSSVGSQLNSPPPLKTYRGPDRNSNSKSKRSTLKWSKIGKRTETPNRQCDLNVPVEWFRYNLVDAVDALEYSLSRLNKLKHEATTMYLRTRSVNEMRNLHKRLDRLLNTSTSRFNEIRENINNELKHYLMRKEGGNSSEEDDVEILHDDNDDPIFIDENSVESNANESQDVDLTVLGSSDHNDSSDKSLDKNDGVQILDPLGNNEHDMDNHSILPDTVTVISNTAKNNEKQSDDMIEPNTNKEKPVDDTVEIIKLKDKDISLNDFKGEKKTVDENHENVNIKVVEEIIDEEILNDSASQSQSDKKSDDQEMSEEMIESLLNDDKQEDSEKKQE